MKKIVFLSFMVAFLVGTSALQAIDSKKDKKARLETVQSKKETPQLSEEEIQRLTVRINEIKQMDINSLTFKEKRELRKELRDIKDKLDTKIDGIYIGGGALLVIIIVLLLLLLL